MVTSVSYKMLYILVEGNDDERFVDAILKPVFENNYNFVRPYKYADKPKKTILKLIKSIHAMGADFFCLADLDNSPCAPHRIGIAKTKKLGNVEDSRVVIAKKAIESWYLAGVNDACCRRLRLPVRNNTDNVDKVQFRQILKQSKLGYTLDCKIQILQDYDLNTGISRNHSFHRFSQKYL